MRNEIPYYYFNNPYYFSLSIKKYEFTREKDGSTPWDELQVKSKQEQ